MTIAGGGRITVAATGSPAKTKSLKTYHNQYLLSG
jgi:hypothetical protein